MTSGKTEPSKSGFVYDERDLPRDPVRMVDVPPGITEKGALFTFFYEAVPLPGYFGHNWDALDECLGDLEWLPQGVVVVRHVDIPLLAAGDVAGARIYLRALKGSLRKFRPNGRTSCVYFSPELRGTVEELLARRGPATGPHG